MARDNHPLWVADRTGGPPSPPPLMKNEKPVTKLKFSLYDPEELKKSQQTEMTLQKSILNILDGDEKSISRLAFEKDPTQTKYAMIYEPKVQLVPDALLKRISIQDSLVAAIVKARSAQVSAFGREQPDRFSTGFRIEPRPGVLEDASDAEKEEVQRRIDAASKLLLTCGKTEGWQDNGRMSLSQFLSMTVRDAVVTGRFAAEVIWTTDIYSNGDRKFHSFRPVDAATIYRATPQQEAAESVRVEARHMLEQIANKKLVPEKFQNDEYKWIQVIDGKPVQAFTAEELVVHDIYPVTDYTLNGYPLTPIDTAIAEITTHINITNHNRLYFQSGRAARGMLVIQSADADMGLVNAIRQQFNAHINSVNNSWRMPVFGVGPEDKVTWQAIDGTGRDMEFQYLSDQNSRVILSAFQMSPDELPGYAHLSRGTNSQALSESSNEYKLEAGRDIGIRPLLAQFQDFLNDRILPLLDEKVAKLCVIRLVGLDADTPEKETTRLQQDGALYMDFSEILERVEKDPIPKEFGGRIPLNPQFLAVAEKYLTFGKFEEYFLGVKGASQDPSKQFYQNPMWFQFQQMQMEMQQMEMQQQQMQMEAAAAGAGGDPNGGPPPEEGEQSEGGEGEEQSEEGDLTNGLNQLAQTLSKSEKQLPLGSRKLLAQHRLTVSSIMDEWEKESKQVVAEILNEVQKPKKR